jgi:hypothetical protein
MAAVRESFWTSKATGRDFFLLGLGLASGGISAALLVMQGEPIYQAARMIETPTSLSGIVTGAGGPAVGMYQIIVSDNVLWRLNTATGELHACGAGPSTGKDQLTVVCAPLTPEAKKTPRASEPTPQPRKRPKNQLASL